MLKQTQILDRFAARLASGEICDASRLQFAAASRVVSLKRDEQARLDESCDQLVFLGSGSTKLVARASQDREQVIAFHFEGDLVCVPARARHSYQLVALRETDIVAMPFDKVVELAGEQREILVSLLDAMRASLARCREKAIALGRKTAPERVASFLVDMAGRTGKIDGKAIILPLPMSRRDIADSLGITIETVSRQLTKLRESGVIETVGRSQIKILDLTTLTEGAGFLSGAS
ncbi:helix-turn-helix domain-containing protein [Erythrobacter mangrovi]|uniref:Helix-turn-helix domain-containing protein n=1 Tax=Erythrobacter mangrovi TaxID=2739433 RepID=A0A7D3XCX7_9SPHN|nr:helix-turn-helix domain-containing protein [Erythrobacter mangrovi]QKG72120.1 helix-turn-helix domain-containing protein [Erythrobacter mangrovi]